MYFSPNRKPSQRRANDEFLRRSVSAEPHAHDESVPTLSRPPEGAMPAPISPLSDQGAPCKEPLCAPSLAMVYCPKQAFGDLYDLETALRRGTLFAPLDLPFEGKGVSRR